MPQIKLAQGFSDIKGKSNGSVFSRNKQGVYFRNNPSGGGKKSDKWNKQKNRFGSLSTAWKNLTVSEQQAWSDIAPLYPALNKFGDSYIASGYQTFMRLNGTINALGFPLLRTPNAPREIPNISEPDFYVPENFCFAPNRVAYLGDVQQFMLDKNLNSGNVIPEPVSNSVFATVAIGALDLFESNNSMDNCSFAVRFTPKSNINHVFSAGQVLPLINVGSSETQNISSYIYVQDAKTSFLCLAYFFENNANDPFLYFCYTPILNTLISAGFHFGLQYDGTANDSFKLYLDGVKISLVGKNWYADPSNRPAWVFIEKPSPVSVPANKNGFKDDAWLTIGFPNSNYFNLFNASDFRYISNANQPNTECESDADCTGYAQCYMGICVDGPDLNVPCEDWQFLMMSFGYVLGYEDVIIPLNTYSDGSFKSAIGVGREFSMSYVLNVSELEAFKIENIVFSLNFVLFQNLHSYMPMVYLKRVDSEFSGFALNVFCTGGISAGRSLNQVPYKSIASVPFNSNAFLLSISMVKNFGSIAFDSVFEFKSYVLDTTTGFLSKAPLQVAKIPRRRWKAGSDLSSSVN
jgi:hypothetical protein